jgi:hypothetical protein
MKLKHFQKGGEPLIPNIEANDIKPEAILVAFYCNDYSPFAPYMSNKLSRAVSHVM